MTTFQAPGGKGVEETGVSPARIYRGSSRSRGAGVHQKVHAQVDRQLNRPRTIEVLVEHLALGGGEAKWRKSAKRLVYPLLQIRCAGRTVRTARAVAKRMPRGEV